MVVVVDLSRPAEALVAAKHYLGLIRQRTSSLYALMRSRGMRGPDNLLKRAKDAFVTRRVYRPLCRT